MRPRNAIVPMTANNGPEQRYLRLVAWATEYLGGPLDWSTVSADASQRRYFRAQRGGQSWIVVDAPPEHEDIAAFVRIAGLLQAAGLNAPRVLACDDRQGFMCLSDLGRQTYLDVLNEGNADELFGAAMDSLLAWQAASRPGVLPDYDRATFARELQLFRQWYVRAGLAHELSRRDSAGMDAAFEFLLDRIARQPPVYVHRDYMPRNLMICEPMPGIIDFQDARYGPATYDLASLFRDAFISWPDGYIEKWTHDYWLRAREMNLPVAADWAAFCADLALVGAQRHLKVLGIFVRLARRDGKTHYATDLKRFRGYLAPVVDAYPELFPLKPFIREEQVQV